MNFRDFLKKIGRTFLGARLYARLAPGYIWGRTLIDYYLMRLPFLKIGAWPHALYIEGTNICNAQCVFCAYPELARAKKIMSLDFFKGVIDQYEATGGDEVDLTPIVGDPFVDKHLFERLEYLNVKPGIRRFHFYTNAIGMKPAIVERLLGYPEKLCVNISYGGFDRETYHKVMGVDQFDVVTANVRYLLKRKQETGSTLRVQVNLRTPRTNNHGEFFEQLLSLKRQAVIELTWMGAYDSWAQHIKEHELTEVGLVPRKAPVKKGPCHRLLTSPVVLADGRVNACACRDMEASLIIGDLKKQKLSEILAGPELRSLLKRHARGDFPEVCRRCTYYDSIYPRWIQGDACLPDPSVPVVGSFEGK